MAKLKLKSVQNGTEIENPNLLDNGAPNYVNDQGYTIVGSGIFDNSGNLMTEGQISVDGGREIIYLGNFPRFLATARWGSGIFDIPVSFNENGGCVPVMFEIDPNYLDYYSGYEVINANGLEVEELWLSPFTVKLSVNYILKKTNGWGQTSGTTYDLFSIPFSYIPPEPEEDEE